MRVLHVVGNIDPDSGGSTSAAFHTSGYLRKHGVETVLAGTWHGPQAADYIKEQWPDLPVYGFSRRAPHHYWHSPDLRRWLQAEVQSFDLVVVNGLFKFPFVDAARAARRSHVPYLVQPHGSLDPWDLRKHRLLKLAYGTLVARRLLMHAAGVIVTSEREGGQLVTYGASCKVSVVPLPVTGPTTAGDGARFRSSIGVPDTAPLVLFLSRVDPKKGLERLLQAVAKLRSSHPGLTLAIVGAAEDPGYEAKLRRLATDLGVNDSVVWAGLLVGEQKWDAFAGGDVFTLPSDYENFGIVVIEALLAETPVVISEGVYISDDLAAAGVAFLCGRDEDSLVARLDEVLTDSTGAAVVAKRGKQVVERNFSPKAATATAIAAYEASLAQRRDAEVSDGR
jgi:glycosyltransferase involved in cell wall biosynthesis